MSRTFSWLLVVLAGAGLAATVFWIEVSDASDYAGARAAALAVCLALIVACTTVNLGIRWLRWHFLLRRFDIRLHTRDSVRLYFSTLPALATPLYLGELVRAPLLAGRFRDARWAVPVVWAAERVTDASVLSSVLLYALGHRLAAGALLGGWLLAASGSRLARPSQSGRPLIERLPVLGTPLVMTGLLGATLAAWLLPFVALDLSLGILGNPLPFQRSAGAFSYGTLLGGVAGIPLGTGITGSAMIVALENAGVPTDAAAVTVAVFRAGTAWYAVALGLAVLVRSRRKLLAFIRPALAADHFDLIASDYPDQIPAHIRDRLLGRKVAVMRRRLDEYGIKPGARGLDVGCGQGWYAVEMALAGYEMTAFDQSADQIAGARRHAAERGARVELAILDAARLPYPDASFDFAYGINVLHHIGSAPARASVLREIVRVLKPGGVFFLHEINTENPLFRLYMGYLFPLLCEIDEGTERWIRPSELPDVEGAAWETEVDYFTFLPDFTPRALMRLLRPIEAALERSPLAKWSAHFTARLVSERAEGAERAVAIQAHSAPLPPRVQKRAEAPK
ncbi:MAG TPA: methyltransferase domain-containing protein [Vicinamibacterales bacterium]|nr:methyltransferase domain-containing protein [Vicinamibacterales bacterium]